VEPLIIVLVIVLAFRTSTFKTADIDAALQVLGGLPAYLKTELQSSA